MNDSSTTLFWVNKRPVAGETLRQLLLIEDDGTFLTVLVEQSVVDAECERRQIEVKPQAVSDELNLIRRSKRLYSKVDTEKWLQENGLSDNDFENLVKARVRRKELKNQIVEGKVEKYFAMEKWRFDSADLYRIKVTKKSTAEELTAQLKEGAEFFGLAKKYSEERSSSHSCGYIGKIMREQMRPEIESQIFKAQSGEIVGPIESVDGFHIYLVEKIELAKLDESVILKVEDKLFQEWLKEHMDLVEISYKQQSASEMGR
jgi:parvulin-like peptidyl-prolyl isomerase